MIPVISARFTTSPFCRCKLVTTFLPIVAAALLVVPQRRASHSIHGKCRLSRLRERGNAGAGEQNPHCHRIPASFFALPKIPSSIAGVNLPVNIFCWLG